MSHLLVFLLSAVLTFAQASSYAIAPTQGTRIELLVAKTGLLRGKQHLFVFDRYQGTLTYDPQKPESSRVTFTIAAGSAVCKDTWVSAKDLRKVQDYALKDMLDAERHPNITFASTAIRPLSDRKFEVQGDLTIRNVAKPVVTTVSMSNRADGSLSAEGTAQIRLLDYGLKPPSAAFGTIGTRNEMALSFTLVALPQGR